MNAYIKCVMVGVLCLVLTAGVTLGIAQATTGTITGTVVDQSAATLQRANVTVRNVATNIIGTKQTAADGRFSFPGLPIGNYEVTVELAGFDKYVRGPLVLTLNQTAVVDAELTVAGIARTVTVTDDAPIINTTNSEIGVVFDERRVTDLPNPGLGALGGGTRDIFGLGLSAPGVSQINQGNFIGPNGTDYSVNGNRLRSNSFNFDGQNVNDPTSAGRQLPWNNPDAIQEFRMITNQFSAEHGGASGSIVSVATKSGTNSLHGTLFWFHNSNSFNSRSNLDKAGGFKEAPFRIENQFGGTVGGPLVRDKTFFFGSLQRWTDRNLGSAATISSVPTEGGRTLLRANGGTRVTTQALLENLPAAQSGQTDVKRYCFNATPWTGGATGRVAPPAVTANPSSPGQFTCGPATAPVAGWSVLTVPVGTLNNSNLIRYNDWQGSFRVDHYFNNRHRITGRYMFNDDILTGAGQATPPGLANIFPTRSQAATIGWTSTLSPTFLNELRVSWSRFAFNSSPQTETGLRIPSIEIGELGLNGFSSVGPVVTRTGIGYATNLPEGRRNNIYQLVNNMTWTHGGHTTKWGMDIRKQELASYFNPNVRGQLRYSSLTNFVADFADLTATINRPLPGGQLVMHFNWTDWFFFAQDDWKVTPNFTLNLGLRYELPGNAIESVYPVNDRIVSTNGNNPLFRYNSRPPRDRNNFMPRFGFNWNLGGKGVGFLENMVLRGGYARTNDSAFLIMAVQVPTGFPFQAAFNIAGTAETLANLSTQTLSLTAAPLLTQTRLADDFRTPYSDQYSLEVQRGVGANSVFRVGYVGTKGAGLFQSQEGNPIARCGTASCTRMDPTRGVMRVRSNTGSSIYHSMQVSFDHRFSRGLSGGAHYTWSAFIDNGSEIINPSVSEIATPQDPFNRNAGERARSTYDRPHRLTGNLVYELPFMKNRPDAAGRIAGAWQVGTLLTFQSGSPFTVLNGSDPGRVLLGSLVGNAIRPNFAPDVNLEELRKMDVSEIRRRVLEAGSPSVFFRALTTNGGPTASAPTGNVPRNFLRSDGIVSIDFNIVKNIRITEGHTLQFRADVFNLPNTRNFGIPTALASDFAGFLNEGATDAGNRRIFLSLRYRF